MVGNLLLLLLLQVKSTPMSTRARVLVVEVLVLKYSLGVLFTVDFCICGLVIA